ncbi:hypothetical protein BDV28DRAFT_129142 [Aspergillus coremiiformis]|uniref:Protein kinase domain-containing protein n=1 Tax=Aspergillus coremiiformis TaxID=138285 RepID=A0A5N6ZEX6_9EURO|nr:hypothetical protein BDV28DRAFT_129142 [Aspergillus coremiiformis]
MVLWLILLLRGGSRVRCVAKTFSDFSIEEAEAMIRMAGLNPAIFSAHEVQRQLDPFLVEARAIEHIERFCPVSRRIYFPRYLGVITDIKRHEYHSSCILRRRAVVLEAIFPKLRSRRILAQTNTHHDSLIQEFRERLQIDILNISPFEKDWYTSLFSNRLRQITTLHDIGITHGDVRDDHFRLPEDYYDTVLYDFSASYTFSPSMPCNKRRRRPLLTVAKLERQQLHRIILNRAKKFDFRHHLAEDSHSDLDTVEKLCFETSEKDEEILELIVFKVANRPDEFKMPSLASLFPFLESIRPKEHPTWHIIRARCLPRYTYAWAIQDMSNTKLISLDGESFVDMEKSDMHGETCVLILFPRSWDKNEVRERLAVVCGQVKSSDETGIIISQSEFQKM